MTPRLKTKRTYRRFLRTFFVIVSIGFMMYPLSSCSSPYSWERREDLRLTIYDPMIQDWQRRQSNRVVKVRPKTITLSYVESINRKINDLIEYTPDVFSIGIPQVWPTRNELIKKHGKILADCKGYAVYKYERLTQIGIPVDDLALIVVMTAQGELHMVLGWYQGDSTIPLILDNRDSAIWAADKTEYRPVVIFNEKKIWSN